MLDEWMDILWGYILAGVSYLVKGLDTVVAPLNGLGPAAAIIAIAIATVAVTKLLSRTIITNRYRVLKSEFKHWYHIRQEALQCGDPEKAKALSKNIDSAKLNEVYYNYFFESLMLSLVTKYIPILLLLSYVNEAYRPERLLENFGRSYIFRFEQFSEQPVLVGSVFWFVVSLILVYAAWGAAKRISPAWFEKFKTYMMGRGIPEV